MKIKKSVSASISNIAGIQNIPTQHAELLQGGRNTTGTTGGSGSGGEGDQFDGSTDEQGPSEIDL